MSPRAIFAALSVLAAACAAGNGPAVPVGTENREPPGVTNEPGAQGPEPGSGGYEPPTVASDATCPACDFVYRCTATDGVNTQMVEVPLVTSTSNGTTQCLYDGSQFTVFDCSGFIDVIAQPVVPVGGNGGGTGGNGGGTTSGGAPTVTQVPWTPYAAGGFSVGFAGKSVTCVPEKPYVPPADAGVPVVAG